MMRGCHVFLLLAASGAMRGCEAFVGGRGIVARPSAGTRAVRMSKDPSKEADTLQEKDESDAFGIDAGERARQAAEENFEMGVSMENEEDIRRLVFDYDPDEEELPIPSEGLMADDSVIPADPNAVSTRDEVDKMVGEGPMPMTGPASPDVGGLGGTEVSMTLEGDLVLGEDQGGSLVLPDFEDFKRKEEKKEAEAEQSEPESFLPLPERTRQNMLDALELDPFADSDFERFESEDYDLVSALIGEGSRPFLGIPLPYLQTGHSALLLTILVMAFVDVAGNPLTELPTEIRDFFKTGLLVVYAINAGVAALSVKQAEIRSQPKAFWAVKSLLLGGLALKELTEIAPSKK